MIIISSLLQYVYYIEYKYTSIELLHLHKTTHNYTNYNNAVNYIMLNVRLAIVNIRTFTFSVDSNINNAT